MSLSDEERRAIVMYRIEKAQTALADIHKILPLGMWSIIANRLYYALYLLCRFGFADSHPP